MNSREKPMKTISFCKRLLPMLPMLTGVSLRLLLMILNKLQSNTVNTSNNLALIENSRPVPGSALSSASGPLLARGTSKSPPLEALFQKKGEEKMEDRFDAYFDDWAIVRLKESAKLFFNFHHRDHAAIRAGMADWHNYICKRLSAYCHRRVEPWLRNQAGKECKSL